MHVHSIRLAPVLAAGFAAVALGACGSSSSTSTTTVTEPAATSTTSEGGESTAALTIKGGEFFFQPAAATTSAGSVDVTLDNSQGKVEHELVLAKTNLDPAKLPTEPDGEVNEDKLDSPGEIPDVEAGKSESASIKLTPGNYVMFCNLPGHYKGGMYGSLTVN